MRTWRIRKLAGFALAAAGLLISVSLAGAATTRYVDVNNPTPLSPYTNWSSAAVTIQAAIEVAVAGDEVVVTNGIYQTGGRAMTLTMSNRVAIYKAVTVRSVNGPDATVIRGYQVPTLTNGDGAVRCLWLSAGASLAGFTLIGGATRAAGSAPDQTAGGGVWVSAPTCVVSNCVLTGNSAAYGGGGAYKVSLANCVLSNNVAPSGGGAYSANLTNCTLTGNSASTNGGGAYSGTLQNCVLTGNSAADGGGAYSTILSNCTLTNNQASHQGGGANLGTLTACTLAGNLAGYSGGGTFQANVTNCTFTANSAPYGGGADNGTLTNCTLTANSAFTSFGGGAAYATLNKCVLTANRAATDGGGAQYGKLNNCVVVGNVASRWGGGAFLATLYNCTLTGNSAILGGGAESCDLRNCILYYNSAGTAQNYYAGSLTNCCTTPLPGSGANNIAAEPQLASCSHLSAGSPCRGAGSAAFAKGTDIDGEPWATIPSMGCDEYYGGSVTGAVSVAIVAAYRNVAIGMSVDFQAVITGRVSASSWDFGDGNVVSNRPYASHAWGTAGDYSVILNAYNDSYPGGIAATATVHVISQPVHYVAATNRAPVPPYASWETAATNIQDAVDIATAAGALVLVNDGVYGTGGRVVSGALSNRVAVTMPIVVHSVNGAGATVITGLPLPGSTNGDGAVRCVYLTSGATLAGFTLTNGATRVAGDQGQEQSGGGVWCASSSAVVSNCVILGNSAAYAGGGAYLGTFQHCTLAGNSARYGGAAYYATLNNCSTTGNMASSGGGAYSSTLNNSVLTANSAAVNGGGCYGGSANNCTLTGNSAADTGGGAYSGGLNNCIVYYNVATNAPNYSGSSLNYSCTSPLPGSGNGNIAAEPQLASASRLNAASPCRGAGSAAYASGTDIDGDPWATPPSIGCDEFYAGTVTGALSVSIQAAYTNVMPGFELSLTAGIVGRPTASHWEFGDGSVISNRPYASHTWSELGDYSVILRAYNDTNPGGISATVLVHVISQPVHYVSAESASPQAPYSSWATAATNIQDAVTAASVPGALVLVNNGVYSAGGRIVFGALSNRVAVTLPLVVQSVNGPGVTSIQGHQVPGSTNGDGAVRCVCLTSGATLAGFTLVSGATRAAGDAIQEQSGGGVWCACSSTVVSNCVLSGNAAGANGGGAYSGTLIDCTLAGNSASAGGGAYSCSLNDCSITGNRASSGGGAYGGILSNCTLTGSSALNGGGAFLATLNDCTLAGNSALNNGGGVYSGSLTNCALSGNSATYGGGAYSATLDSCVLSSNSVSAWGGGTYAGTATNCTFTANSAGGFGGGAYTSGLYTCTFTLNSAYDGGGAHSSTLANCLLAGNSASDEGGGMNSCTGTRCTVMTNFASFLGGGVYGGSLNNSVLAGNAATEGGGSYSAVLTNCTLTGNSAANGGGANSCTLDNCIVYYNLASITGANDSGSSFNFSCTTPLPGAGTGNIAAEPQLASASHISAVSPCRGAGGSLYASGLDIDGELWAKPPSMGCDEPYVATASGPVTVSLQAAYTNVAAGFLLDLVAGITGRVTASRWELGDGMVLSNRPYASYAWSAPGNYSVVVRAFNDSNPGGVSATVTVHVVTQPVHYVAATNTSPKQPYSSWATAATNIQDAVDAATVPGALVLVTNGTYGAGGRIVFGTMSNRVAITEPLVLQSVNGPEVTVIRGYQVPGTTNGDGAVRCVYLTDGALCLGFTLANGATRAAGDQGQEQGGGGVWCASSSAVVSNCVLSGNCSASQGGGAYGGTFNNCVLTSNSSGFSGGGAIGANLNDCTLLANCANWYGGGAEVCNLNRCFLTSNYMASTSAGRYGGGAYECSLSNCTLTGNSAYWGGGAANGTLDNCTLTSNSAVWGGGIDGCTLNNCALTGNSATGGGGGAHISFLNNCLLAGNQAAYGGGAYQSSLTGCTVANNSASSYGGGTEGGSLNNCIAYYNTAPDFPNYDGSLNNCCAVPLPDADSGNFTNAPLFVAPTTANYHLQANSPCINAGRNSYVSGATDLDGNPRIVAGTVDVGAYEFQTPSSRISYAWLQQYGLPPDDSTDTDGDGMNNWQEWIAGTDPTNAASVLVLQPPAVALPGLVLRWSSDTSHSYFVESAMSLGGPLAFSLLGTNIPGLAGTTTYTDTSALSQPAAFYRVGTDSTSGSTLLSLQLPVWFPGSATLTWSSVATRSYSLERAMDVGGTSAFSLLSSNIAGQVGTTSFTDTNAITGPPCFYRVRVEQ